MYKRNEKKKEEDEKEEEENEEKEEKKRRETSRTEFGQQMRSLANCPRTCLSIVFLMAHFLIPDAILFEFGPFLRNSTRV